MPTRVKLDDTSARRIDMSASNLPRVLYVEPDAPSREFFKRWITRNAKKCELVCADGAADAMEKISGPPFDLYLFEYCLGDMTGPELCREIRGTDNRTPVVICSSLSREIDRNTAFTAGATGYVVKPAELARLAAIMRRVLGPPKTRKTSHTLRRCSAII
jgi:DNA-binding response OmpR family regulator